MAIIRWRPFEDLVPSSLWEPWHLLEPETIDELYRARVSDCTWTPRATIHESDKTVEITVELPGLTQEEVQVGVTDNILTVSGERKLEFEDECYSSVEGFYGRFNRSFALSDTVNADGIEAKMTNGILKITLPKAEEKKPRQIEIKGS